MGRNKRGSAANEIYNTHLFGVDGKFFPNSAQQREFLIQRNIEADITDLAMNRFKYDGLDDPNIAIDERFLEMCLFYNGLCVVYQDDDYEKLLAVRGTGTGYVNMLDNPVAFTVIGPGSISKPLDDTAPAQFKNKMLSAYQPVAHSQLDDDEKRKKGVAIYPNYLRRPEVEKVRLYASRLANIDRTIEINVKNARRNKVIKTSQNMQLSAVNFARGIDVGDELLQITGPMQDMDFIEALDLGVTPESYEKLHVLRARVWNEIMTLLGIDSANQDKKERMVAAEVSANDEQTESMKFVALNARRQGLKQINDVFGTNITVEYNTTAKEEEAQDKVLNANANVNDNKEGDDNGNVHNDSK